MNERIELAQRALLLTGRALLGLYFVVPGITKILGWEQTATAMAAHDVPLIPLLLPLTIVLQIGAGGALMVGYRAAIMAFLLAGLTLMINLFMHDFWNVEEARVDRETQNFIKNLAIMAGLMVVAGDRRNG